LNTKAIGNLAEARAAQLLIQKGHTVLKCNWRYGRLEIDLVSKYKHILVFTEVKHISKFVAGDLRLKINPKKQANLIKAAAEYMRIFASDNMEYRFDVICFSKKHQPLHIEAAFYPTYE